MGVAVVRGLQGPADAKYDKLHACAKHYAVHSGPEAKRHYFDVEQLDPRDLWETYFAGFQGVGPRSRCERSDVCLSAFRGRTSLREQTPASSNPARRMGV